MRNQIIVSCKASECFSSLVAKRRFSSSRVGMYLNWKRSRRNTASTVHTNTRIPKHCVWFVIVAWVQDRVTHNVEVRLHRAQHLSQYSSPATIRSLHQSPSTSLSRILGKSQHRRHFFFTSPGEELRMVGCPLPLYGKSSSASRPSSWPSARAMTSTSLFYCTAQLHPISKHSLFSLKSTLNYVWHGCIEQLTILKENTNK